MSIYEKAVAQMQENVKRQDALYDKLVMPSITNGDMDIITENFKQYQKELRGFDARAFRKTVQHITTLAESDPEEFANIQDQFQSIPKYVNERQNFKARLDELNETDATPQEKQAMWETLDRKRTMAHNGCISLFNKINQIAQENGIAEPYPNSNMAFDPKNPADRELVGNIIDQQEPLLDTVNQLMSEQQEKSQTQSTTEKLRSMSLMELYEYAKAHVKAPKLNFDGLEPSLQQ